MAFPGDPDGRLGAGNGFICYIGVNIVKTSSRILISGATGLIGTALIPTLEARGLKITRLVRTGATVETQIEWDSTKPLRPDLVSGFDAVIHLSGEPVMGLWTEAKKARIRDSRVLSTTHLSEALAQTSQPPRVFISGSATGYYGDRGDEVLREDSPSGEGFLPEVCRQWEAATKPAEDSKIRISHIRTGIVLSGAGGALRAMLPNFKLGLGGKMGSGRQWMSWIHMQDLIGAIHHVLDHDPVHGAVNLVAPSPVRNSEFTENLAAALSRPAILRMPAFALRLVMGQMAQELLLASQRVEPAILIGSGYQFKFQDLQTALSEILHRGM